MVVDRWQAKLTADFVVGISVIFFFFLVVVVVVDLVLINKTDGSTISACPIHNGFTTPSHTFSKFLYFFFNESNVEGIKSSKCCLMFCVT